MESLDATTKKSQGKSGFRVLPIRLHAVAHWFVAFWTRIAPVGAPLIYLVTMIAIGAFAWLRPIHGWDTLQYLAAAAWDGESEFSMVHREVYRMVQEAVSPAEYAALTEGDAYRLRQFTDGDAFRSMLGMYEVKWLYVRLIDALSAYMPAVKATVAINMAALALMTISVGAWASRHRLWVALPLVPALFLAVGLGELVRLTTPDMLACALVLSGVLMIDRQRPIGAAMALTFAVLARPDNVVLALLIVALFALVGDRRWMQLLPAAMGAFAAYLFVTASSHHIGYSAHLWFSTYQMQDTMEGFAPVLTVKVYLTAFAYNLARAATENTWLGLWAIGIMAWLIAASRSLGRDGGRDALALTCFGAIAAKFILFPLHDARTYLPILIPGLMLVAAMWTPYRYKRAA